MNWNKIEEWKDDERIEALRNAIENDNNYWKKILVLMTMKNDDEENELMETILENRRKEMEIFEKKFGISLKKEFSYKQIQESTKDRDFNYIMKTMVENKNDNYLHSRACKQVLEILHCMPKEYYEKINLNFIKNLEEQSKSIEQMEIKEVCDFDKLDILEETKDMLALISNKFWNDKK